MFTSRAEYRLHLRIDNADQRLTPLAESRGLVSEDRVTGFARKMEAFEGARAVLQGSRFSPQQVAVAGLTLNQDGRLRDGEDLLALEGVEITDLISLLPELSEVDAATAAQLKIDATYKTYLERQARAAEGLKRDEARRIPEGFDYDALPGLSNELRSKLNLVRPESVGQAGRIEGMTPAALTLILSTILRDARKTA
jgi:tRNA uridine 5-carboxymethylaminomethyl modification enzyme